jgi:hypothetical protein
VRNAEAHFSLFLLPFSFFSSGSKEVFVKKEEERRQKEEATPGFYWPLFTHTLQVIDQRWQMSNDQ